MLHRDVVFRGGVAKLERPKGKRPSDMTSDIKCSIKVITPNVEPTIQSIVQKHVFLEDEKIDKFIAIKVAEEVALKEIAAARAKAE